jgi:hypothetical protein
MIHFSGAAGSMPADSERPGWAWLQERVERLRGRERLRDWLSSELEVLELRHADCVTQNSRQRANRQHLGR